MAPFSTIVMCGKCVNIETMTVGFLCRSMLANVLIEAALIGANILCCRMPLAIVCVQYKKTVSAVRWRSAVVCATLRACLCAHASSDLELM